MKTPSGQKTSEALLILTKRHEEILKTIYFYRYMTALDVAYRLFSTGSRTHVRDLLSRLAGGADGQKNQYLYRFQLPRTSPGNTEKIYTLGSRGRDFLASELGLPVGWYFRPEKLKHLSLGHVAHNLVLTRFLVAASRWCASRPDFQLAKTRISYELEKTPARLEVAKGNRTEALTVVPDAWLLFEEFREGVHRRWLPVLLEIDRGTEYQQKFKQHVRSRIEFIRSGSYRNLFETEAVTIAYVTTGETPDYRETRRKTMCAWIQEVLVEQHREAWAPVFRICSLHRETLYDTPLFTEPLWYQPDQPAPVTLF